MVIEGKERGGPELSKEDKLRIANELTKEIVNGNKPFDLLNVRSRAKTVLQQEGYANVSYEDISNIVEATKQGVYLACAEGRYSADKLDPNQKKELEHTKREREKNQAEQEARKERTTLAEQIANEKIQETERKATREGLEEMVDVVDRKAALALFKNSGAIDRKSDEAAVYLRNGETKNTVVGQETSYPKLEVLYGQIHTWFSGLSIEKQRKLYDTTYFKQHKGKENNNPVQSDAHSSDRQKHEAYTQELQNDARNYLKLKYVLAISEYQVLLDMGVPHEKIQCDIENGVSYIADEGLAQKVKTAYEQAVTKKQQAMEGINKKYNDTTTSVNDYYDALQATACKSEKNIQYYNAATGSCNEKLFWKDYVGMQSLQSDLLKQEEKNRIISQAGWDRIGRNVFGDKTDSKGTPLYQCYGDIKLAEKKFAELDKKTENSQLSEEEQGIYATLLYGFMLLGGVAQQVLQEKVGENYGAMLDIVAKTEEKKPAKGVREKYKEYLQKMEAEGKKELVVEGVTAWEKNLFGANNESKYYRGLQQISEFVYRDAVPNFAKQGAADGIADNLQVVAPALHAYYSNKWYDNKTKDVTFEEMKTKNPGRYILASAVMGGGTAMQNAFTWPVSLYEQMNIAFANESDKQWERDHHSDGMRGKFMSIYEAPEVMTKPVYTMEGGMNWGSVPYQVSKTGMDMAMLFAGRGILKKSAGFLKLEARLGQGVVGRFAANTAALLPVSGALHMHDHVKTANNAGLSGMESIGYGVLATLVESSIESLGGFTAGNFFKSLLKKEVTEEVSKGLGKEMVYVMLVGKFGKMVLEETGEELLTEGVMHAIEKVWNGGMGVKFEAKTWDTYLNVAVLTMLTTGLLTGGKVGGQVVDVEYADAQRKKKIEELRKIPGFVEQATQMLAMMKLLSEEDKKRDDIAQMLATLQMIVGEESKEGGKEKVNDEMNAIEGNEVLNNKARNRQQVYENLNIEDDVIRVQGAIASLQEQGLLPGTLSDEQTETLFAIILYAHTHWNNRPATNADGTARTPLATVKDADGSDVSLYALSTEDRNAEYSYLKTELGKLGWIDASGKLIDATMIAKVLMREGWCGAIVLRDYQEKILNAIDQRVNDRLHGKLDTRDTPNPAIKNNSIFLNVATGGGKTVMVGSLLEKVWGSNNTRENSQPLNILVTTDRIGLVEQIRREFFEGKKDSAGNILSEPLLSEGFRNETTTYIYHSESDDRPTESFQDITQNAGKSNTMYNVTLQTLADKTVEGSLSGNLDVIFVDEADIVGETSVYLNTLQKYYKPNKQGRYPLIIAVTATPDNQTVAVFGNPTANFGLGEYLASKRSPVVDYQMITPEVYDEDVMKSIEDEIISAQAIEEPTKKKQAIKKIKETIEGLFASIGKDDRNEFLQRSLNVLVQRIDPTQKTLVFAKSIEEANIIATTLNQHYGNTIAVARHSENIDAVDTTMQDLREGKCSIVVAVGQLDRGIDVPSLDNVVFLSDTDSPKRYLQRFGRGTRGTKVTILDFVGGIRNMAYIGNIYKEYQEKKQSQNNEKEGSEDSDIDENFSRSIDAIAITPASEAGISRITLGTLLQKTLALESTLDKLTAEKAIEIIKELFPTAEMFDGLKIQGEKPSWVKGFDDRLPGSTALGTLLGIDKSIKMQTQAGKDAVREKVYGEKVENLTAEKAVEIIKENFPAAELFDALKIGGKKPSWVSGFDDRLPGFMALGRLLGIDKNIKMQTQAGKDAVREKVYGEKVENLTAEKAVEIIKENFPAAELFDALKIGGKKPSWVSGFDDRLPLYTALGTLLGIDKNIKMQTQAGKDAVREKVYGEKVENLTAEKAVEIIKENFSTVELFDALKLRGGEPSWMSGFDDRLPGATTLGILLGIDKSIKMQAQAGKDAVRQKVYGEKVEKLTPEKAILIIRENFPTVEMFDGLKIQGQAPSWVSGFDDRLPGFMALGRLLGIDKNIKMQTQAGKDAVREKVYGEKVEKLTAEKAVEIIKENFSTVELFDALKIGGKKPSWVSGFDDRLPGFMALGRLLGIDKNIKMQTQAGKDAVREKVYGEKVENLTAEKAVEIIKENFPAAELFDALKIGGKKPSWVSGFDDRLPLYTALGTLLGIDKNIKMQTQAGKDAVREKVYGEKVENLTAEKAVEIIKENFSTVELFDALKIGGKKPSWVSGFDDRLPGAKGLGTLLGIDNNINMLNQEGKDEVRRIVYNR